MTILLAWLAVSPRVSADQSIVLRPAAVFDGQEVHAGWSMLVTDDKIAAAGPNVSVPVSARVCGGGSGRRLLVHDADVSRIVGRRE